MQNRVPPMQFERLQEKNSDLYETLELNDDEMLKRYSMKI
jgi:hypothetical protein